MTKQILVIAAHADDETLGCYYAMRRHLLAGDDVSVLLMTSDKLRRTELRQALATLSDYVQRYTPPGLVDSQVHRNLPKAAQIVLQTVLRVRPDIVYCHSRKEPAFVSDHKAVFKATLAALKLYGKRVELMEYPVWQYCSYPWVPTPRRGSKSATVYTLQLLRYYWRSLVSPVRFGWQGYYSVVYHDEPQLKHSALLCYNSQLPGLQNVAGGEFLEQFYAREVFKQSTIN